MDKQCETHPRRAIVEVSFPSGMELGAGYHTKDKRSSETQGASRREVWEKRRIRAE